MTSVLDYRQLRPSLFPHLPQSLPSTSDSPPQLSCFSIFSILNLYFLLFLSIPIQVIRNFWILETKLLCLLIQFYKGMSLTTRAPWKEQQTGVESCILSPLRTWECPSWVCGDTNYMVSRLSQVSSAGAQGLLTAKSKWGAIWHGW